MERCDGRKSSKQRLDHPLHHEPTGERVEVGSITSSFVGGIKKNKQTTKQICVWNVLYFTTNVKYYSIDRFACRFINIYRVSRRGYASSLSRSRRVLLHLRSTFPLPHLSAHISPANQSHLDPIHLQSATVFRSQIQACPLSRCPLCYA